MARDWTINGPTLVKVKGGAHLSGILFPAPAELGLSTDAITISPKFIHRDVRVDDFGPSIPAEVMWQLAEVKITMSLVHYDRNILDYCTSESMGGTLPGPLGADDRPLQQFAFAGTLAPAGTPLGRGLNLFASGNNYLSVSLTSPELGWPWRFPTSYLNSNPYIIPLGTEKSIVQLSWRVIPYAPLTSEIICSGNILWDHDTESSTL